jgi:hypothetical protein
VIQIALQPVEHPQHLVRVLDERAFFMETGRPSVRHPSHDDQGDGADEEADVDRRLNAADAWAGLERHRSGRLLTPRQ